MRDSADREEVKGIKDEVRKVELDLERVAKV
jgi:hypothetical protein